MKAFMQQYRRASAVASKAFLRKTSSKRLPQESEMKTFSAPTESRSSIPTVNATNTF